MSNAEFVVYEDSSGKWRWRLVHRNGNILADSGQDYSSKQKAHQGIDSIRRNAVDATVNHIDNAEFSSASNISQSE